MSEYKIMKIEDGKIKDVSYEQLKKEIIAEHNQELYHDIQLARDKITEICVEHFGEGKVEQKTNLSQLTRDLMLSKSKFKIADIKTDIVSKYNNTFTMSTLKSVPYTVAYALVEEGLVKRVDNSDVYINLKFEDKDVLEDDTEDNDLAETQ